MTIRRGNLFAGARRSSPAERFDELCSGQSFRLERIISTGQATPPGEWYDQPHEEWVVLLTGSATLRLEEPRDVIDLSPGDWIFLPAHVRHRVERTSDGEPTVWLALHGAIDLADVVES